MRMYVCLYVYMWVWIYKAVCGTYLCLYEGRKRESIRKDVQCMCM